MKLELLDAYNIRARLSASIILLAPIVITMFLCFEDVFSFASSSALLCVLLAFTNYVPIMQHRIRRKRIPTTNYAVQLLTANDDTIDSVSKKRYYRKLAKIDKSFSPFEHPDDSEVFHNCCNSAVIYLRNNTRDNHLVQEKNITYGFCKNLLADKTAGIILCAVCGGIAAVYSWLEFGALSCIPEKNYFAFATNIVMLLFWIFGITEQVMKDTAIRYAKTLIMSIDSLDL